jgi:hypothetical protein
MKYFVYIRPSGAFSKYTLEFVEKEDLNRIIESYLRGADSFIIEGKKHSLKDVQDIKIFECSVPPDKEDAFIKALTQREAYSGMYDRYLSPDTMREMKGIFEDKTKELIGHQAYGSKAKPSPILPNDLFIDTARVEELRNISISGFDLSRLIKLCEEINSSYANGNFFAVGMLCRALKDHIPPLFASGGRVTFQDVIDAKGLEKSDREALKILAQNKHIQDGFIHSQIKRKESLANSSTVEIRPQIDVLLRMIIEKGES